MTRKAKKSTDSVTPASRLTSKASGHMLGEAVLAYDAGPGPSGEVPMSGITRLSAKNQITLPAGICRELDLRPGDEIDLLALSGRITLERRPRTPEEWAGRLAGALDHVTPWATDEGIQQWIRAERDNWERQPEEG